MIIRSAIVLCLLSFTTLPPGQGQQARDPSRDVFDHTQHRGLFPSCVPCHAGASNTGLPLWPTSASCASCHDGRVEERVDYTPTTLPAATNLRFDHAEHAAAVVADNEEPVLCVQCHSQPEAPWLSVQLAVVDQCLTCHEEPREHYETFNASCAECHVSLADASRLSLSDVAAFPSPRSHNQPRFGLSTHGHAAFDAGTGTVAASCATCHARDFCITCHVDAPEQELIQALDADRRSLAHETAVPAPSSHESDFFLSAHGAESMQAPTSCMTCHTQESCTTCHIATPEVAIALHRAGPGRGVGAVVARIAPQSHDPSYRTTHASEAATVPETCAGCHARQDCFDCHRPDAASASEGYHEPGFLTRHPSAAYARETRCSDCHNDRYFCASCHLATGLTSLTDGVLGAGYHDAKSGFALGHGVAARQSLETCITCHTERDCRSCHSATGARRFSPHGPGFDAERLHDRNPEMCAACHTNIPDIN